MIQFLISRPSRSRAAAGCVLALIAMAAPVGINASDLSYDSIIGRPQGLKITVHEEMARYLETLAERSPLVDVIDQGASWEGKRLLLAVVTSEANHSKLDEIRSNARQLADPRGLSAAEAATIIDRQPAIAWLGGSIHGFELSGAEGVLKLLEHLVTRDDEETRDILDNVVVLLDPMLNPDGRDAFAHHNHARLGRAPNPERDDWGNDFSRWEAVSFRTGHYFFDTNRDWWAHTQRETQARVPTLQAWRPQVIVDLHEMGSNVEFYFDPATDPYGPFFPEFARKWFTRFGKAYASAFDQAGFEYMTRERYNYFYPGYTTSYGSYQGAVGMLYEQGSSRGLAITRADDSVRTLTDAFSQQYTAARAAVRLAAEKRDELLSDYVDAHRKAIEDGTKGRVRYLFGPDGDPNLVTELADLLERNGIEVGRLSADTHLSGVRDRAGASLGRKRFPAGTYVVEAAQPRNRLVRALLEPDLPISEAFLEQARERLDRGGNPRFYDITAWSLPLLFNVEGYSTTDAAALQLDGSDSPESIGSFPENPAYGWVIDGKQTAGLAALYHLKARGHRGSVVLRPSRVGERTFAGGSVVVRAGQNGHLVAGDLRELADRYGLEVSGVDTGLSEEGFPSLGSGDDSFVVREPKIAILAEQPVHGYSFGWAWYTLDQQYGIRTTPRRVSSVGSTPLDEYNVLILPHLFTSDGLAGLLGDGGIARIKRWTNDGGTLVALGTSVDFVRDHLQLTALRSYYDSEKDAGEKSKDEPHRIVAPGAIVSVDLDPESWLAAGYDGSIPALVTSNRVFLEPEGPPASGQRVVGRYAGADTLRISGHLWPENRERLAGAVFAYEERVGSGRVIAFPEDLNFRAYWRGANRLFLNAVILGPSAP